MKKPILIIGLIAACLPLLSQKSSGKASTSSEIKIPMSASRWDFAANSVEFGNHKNVPAMKIVNGGEKITLKDFKFTDGTIEYDVEPQGIGFNGVYFRMADKNETEFFYLRVARAGNPAAMDAAQYAAYNKGVNLWDMLDYYQGPATIKKDDWNHIKLVVSGKQMLVYVNDMLRPTLEVPRLEGNTDEGGLAFNGTSFIANLSIKPGEVEGLSPREGFDPTNRDPRYIRMWQVSEPQPLPKGREVFEGDFPKPSTIWQNINAERRGLMNLTRIYGASESRRFVWMRARLISATEQKRKIAFGFSDEVWVYVNKQLVFVDKNIYISPAMRKNPDGRISIDNAQFEINLKAGENDLMVGVANDFFGWGAIARLDNMEGIEASINFPAPLPLPKDLGPYLGTYKSAEIALTIAIKVESDQVMAQASGQQAIALEYFEKDKFRYEQEGVVLEFYPDEKKMVLKQGGAVIKFVRE